MKSDKKKHKYWNPYLETLDYEKLKLLQLFRFKNIFKYSYTYSPLYRKLYDERSISPESIINIDDIQKVPIINKQFFETYTCDSCYGESLAVPPKEVVYYHQTSGTTHLPLRQPDTLEDWYWWSECWATVLWAQGIRQDDKVLLPFNYNTFIGFWGAHYGCEKIGAEIISTGGLSTRERIEKIFELNVTALITTPTYLFRMLEIANDMRLRMDSSPIKTIICAGEPGALIPATKKYLEAKWGCKVFDHIGATEVGAWGFECISNPGGIHINEAMFLCEIMELNSNNIITQPERYGRLIITAFQRKGRPCVRFDTQDIACWQDYSCECGRTFRLLKGGVQGRADHLLKIRGTLVTPAMIEDIVHKNVHLGTEYLITIGKECEYHLLLEVEVAPKTPIELWEVLRINLQREIHSKTHLSFEVVLRKYGTIHRNNGKSSRVNDMRTK